MSQPLDMDTNSPPETNTSTIPPAKQKHAKQSRKDESDE
jgi:hypothetical protein